MNSALPERARFHHMKDGTAEDWKVIQGEFRDFARALPEWVVFCYDEAYLSICNSSTATAAASLLIA